MNDVEIKSELLSAIEDRWSRLQKLLLKLTPADKERPLADGWTPKQHVAHLTAWERSLFALLRKQQRSQAMGLPVYLWDSADEEKINAFIAEEAAARPLETVAAESIATHGELVRLLESMTPDEFELPYSSYQPFDPEPNARPIIGWVHGNTWEHDEEHIGWLEQGLAAANS